MRPRRAIAPGVILVAVLMASAGGTASAQAAAKAPEGPPLVSSGTGERSSREHSRDTAMGSLGSGSGDPLVSNGMGSPLCSYEARGQLSGAAAANCRTDDFVAAGAPTGDYSFDIHIDRGAFGIGQNDFAATLQNVILTPIWTSLVWTAHTLLVGIEWCYTLNLLDSPSMSSITRALRQVDSAFTQPWLVLVMALAAILAAYHGIVRRRVAETTGQVLMMLAMMAAGLWVIFDPTGTVGALGSWADEASIGTLGAVAHGSPARAPQSLAGSMAELFSSSIQGPWCYMEFGNVSWCQDPSNLDPALHRAALQVAERLPSEPSEGGPHSAELIRAARSNGELFLSLPANGDKRNSINDTSSLLRVLCQTSHATECRGPTAAEAEFRTQGFTMARAVGLLLIIAGLAGMFLTLGFLVLRLLEAAVATLIYLLMAPAAVLAPALGDGGRAAFRSWAARLLGCVASKIVHSFILGLLLLLLSFLVGLDSLGWWIQWLLISTLWWSAFRQRHKLLGLALEPRHSGLRDRAGRFVGFPRFAAESSPVLQGAQWARRRHRERQEEAERRREAARKTDGTAGSDGVPKRTPTQGDQKSNDPAEERTETSGSRTRRTDARPPTSGEPTPAQAPAGSEGADAGDREASEPRQHEPRERQPAEEAEDPRSRTTDLPASSSRDAGLASTLPGGLRAEGEAQTRPEPERGDPQAARMQAVTARENEALRADAPALRLAVRKDTARLERLRGAARQAGARGERKREVSLALRAARVAADVAGGHERLARSRAEAQPPEPPLALLSGLLDEQASLPSARERRGPAAGIHGRSGPALDGSRQGSSGDRGAGSAKTTAEALPAGRDYRALAPLAGYTAEGYELLDPVSRRRARLQIDRELDQRRRLARERRASHARASRAPAGRGHEGARPDGDPASAERPPAGERTGRPGKGDRVMEDAFAVAEGRKRQLGYAGGLVPSRSVRGAADRERDHDGGVTR